MRIRTIVFLACVCVTETVSAVWQVGAALHDASTQVAFESNASSEQVQLEVVEQKIRLRFILAPGFEKFAPGSCPSFQIDKRTPVHHYALKTRCHVEDKTVIFDIGEFDERRIKSLELHRLLNGDALFIRFLLSNGRYRESEFSLTRSKKAFKDLLGFDLHNEVEVQ